MSLFGSKESYLGVDIGANGIKLVELHKTKKRPQLWTYGILEEGLDVHIPQVKEKNIEDLRHEGKVGYKKEKDKKPDNISDLVLQDARIDQYAELLKELIKKTRVQSKKATSSLPVSHVFHTVINLPATEEKEIDQIVRAEIAKMIPHPIEEMQVVHQKVGEEGEKEEKKKYNTILVTAAPKALVAFYTAIFQKAGLQLEELETEAFALARSLVGHDKAVSMVVDVGAERTNLFIIDGAVPMTHRSLQIGGNDFDILLARSLGLDKSEVGQIKKDISLSADETNKLPLDLFRKLLDPISKEIQYSFDLYLKQSGNEQKRPEKIILTGGSSLFPPISRYIEQEFPLRVFVGDPWARVIYQDGLKPVLDKIGPRMAVSIGLALRNF